MRDIEIQIHKIIMSVVAPVQLIIDSSLSQSPHYKFQEYSGQFEVLEYSNNGILGK